MRRLIAVIVLGVSWAVTPPTVNAEEPFVLTFTGVKAGQLPPGFLRMLLRGRVKCHTVATLYAIAHDLMQGMKLRAEVAMHGT